MPPSSLSQPPQARRAALGMAMVALALAAWVAIRPALAQSPVPSVSTSAKQASARPSPEAVQALVALQNWPERLAGLRQTFEGQMQLAVNSRAWSDLKPQVRERLGLQLRDYMLERFAWPGELQGLVVRSYLEAASAADVAVLRTFQESADGQWLEQRLRPALDEVEFALLDRARRDIQAFTNTGLAETMDTSAPLAAPPAAWKPANAHETAARRLLDVTEMKSWQRQLLAIKLRAIERYDDAVGRFPDRRERRSRFAEGLRNAVSVEAYMPQLMAQLTKALGEDEMARAIAIETSADRSQAKAIDHRLGQAFGKHMQAWQRDTLFPGLRQIMDAARQHRPDAGT